MTFFPVVEICPVVKHARVEARFSFHHNLAFSELLPWCWERLRAGGGGDDRG